MASLLAGIRKLNQLGDRRVAEPYAGGAGASLGLLVREETRSILINDLDPAIHDFWWCLLNRSEAFLELIRTTPLDIDEWRRQRDIYRGKRRASRLARGFATFYLNRCNRSGVIMDGGPIGGIGQIGKWKIDARFNRGELVDRCTRLIQYKDRIELSNVDGEEFVRAQNPSTAFLFIDPPYYQKGDLLYLNAMTDEHHQRLAAALRESKESAWVLTYDDCPKIREMYADWANVRSFGLRYSAAERRSGVEVLITPRWMRLPQWQRSEALAW